MGKLHELIAVEPDLKGNAQRVMLEAIATFGKRERFEGYDKSLKMHDDGRQAEEKAGEEHAAVTTTVGDKLGYIKDPIAAYYDAFLQKEATNQTAKSDLTLEDGTVIAKDVPATALLGMETHLKELRKVYEAIPTHKPGIEWVQDPDKGAGIFRTKFPDTTAKTEMTKVPFVLHPGTDKHAPQVQALDQQKVIGTYSKTTYTGTISPAELSDKLARIDLLIRAVKKARQVANCAEVNNMTWGAKILAFIG